MQSKITQATVVALLLNSASADSYSPTADDTINYSDGLGGPAPCLESYFGVGAAEAVGGDPHLVHGITANDGSVVSVGSSLTKGEGFGSGDGYRGLIIRTNTGCTPSGSAFLDKYVTLEGAGSTACSNYKWVTKLDGGVNSRANWVAESNDNTYYIAVGTEAQSDNKSQMVIWKINASDGAITWKMNYGTAGTVTGLESCDFLSNGDLIVGGFTDSEGTMNDQFFKSAGQITFGQPFLAKVSKNDLGTSTAPTSVEWNYGMDGADYTGSAKAIRVDSSDNIYAVVGQKSAAVKLNSAGAEQWKTGQLNSKAQMNDLTLVSDGIAMTGHSYGKTTDECWFSGCGVIAGHMMKLDTSGALQWEKTYGNYPDGINQFANSGEGHWGLVYNECWGIKPKYTSSGTQDGFVLACGTGIEGCPLTANFMPQLYLECKQDPRNKWRGLTIATDLNGDRVWSRMDSFQDGSQPIGSASEYLLSATDGKVTFITDEAFGFGFAKILVGDGTKCADFDGQGAVKLSASALLALGAFYLSL